MLKSLEIDNTVFSGLVIFGNLQSSDIMVWDVITVWRVGCNQVKTASSLEDNRCQIEDKQRADHCNSDMLQDKKFSDPKSRVSGN